MPPRAVINAVAPIRICDIGGWTDTWFARHGTVFNIAVSPFAEVQVLVSDRDDVADRITVSAENFGLRYSLEELQRHYDKLPLVEAAIRRLTIPDHVAVEVRIWCQVPPGASTGTSAAVSVAIIGALDRLTPGRLTPYEVVRLAHAIEVEDLGLQSGVQDQLCSAFGGISLIDMPAYPHANVSPLPVDEQVRWELEHRLTLVYVGRPHQSSEVHRSVIRALGEDASGDPRLERLRRLAVAAKNAICAGDLAAFGRVMDDNVAVQRELHPGLVGESFERVIAIARAHGALGCKVNGAGGDGGSVTILGDGLSATKRAMERALEEAGFSVVPVQLTDRGLRVWMR